MRHASAAWPLGVQALVLPTASTSHAFPFVGFLALVGSACSVFMDTEGPATTHLPLPYLPWRQRPGYGGSWQQAMTGPHSTSPSFALTVVSSCVFHIKGNFGLLCWFSLAPWACEKVGGYGAGAQKKDRAPKAWEEHPGWQAVCSQRRRTCSGS